MNWKEKSYEPSLSITTIVVVLMQWENWEKMRERIEFSSIVSVYWWVENLILSCKPENTRFSFLSMTSKLLHCRELLEDDNDKTRFQTIHIIYINFPSVLLFMLRKRLLKNSKIRKEKWDTWELQLICKIHVLVHPSWCCSCILSRSL